jgi:VacB/RNase II family 3'-5' exoribonuclease
MGKKTKQNKPEKGSGAQTKKDKSSKNRYGNAGFDEDSNGKVLLVNIPKKKQGKFSKDFSKNFGKLLSELDLHPDEGGKIQFKEKKVESMANYGATFNKERFQGKVSKELRNEELIFSQNYLKKPKSNNKKDLIKQIERTKKGKITTEMDPEFDETMDHFFKMMKTSQKKGNFKLKSDFGKPKKRHFSKEDEEEYDQPKSSSKTYKNKQGDSFEPYEDYLDLQEVENGLENQTLFQGIFIVNEKNMHNCFIKCPGIQERIYLQNPQHNNRALQNAIVVFEILKGKPTLIAEDVESITDYEAHRLNVDQPLEEIHNPVEEYVQHKGDLDSGNFVTTEEEREPKDKDHSSSEEDEDISEEDEDEEDDASEEEEDDEDEEEKAKEKEIDDLLDEHELEMFAEDTEDDDLTPEIDDSISYDEEDLEFEQNRPLKKQFHHNKEKKSNQKSKNLPHFSNHHHQAAKSHHNHQENNQNKKETRSRLIGKVVYLVDNPEFSRKFVCTLKKPLGPHNNTLLACPIERKLPIIIVSSAYDRISTDAQKYYLAEFLFWPNNSKYPHGHIIEEIGDMGLIDIESEALLRNYNVYNHDFTEESYAYLQTYEKQMNTETKEYTISDEEREGREDLTKKIVVTCDPVTARDLDDALSITHIRGDIYEIGVHIADVSHFVKEGTAVDDDARLRTTSVYLVQKVIPMLPRLLCENLCSLNPSVERLTFSVFFWVKEDGTLVDTQPPRITKSIIKTCAKLNYDIVQDLIDGKITSAKDLPITYLPEGIDPEQVVRETLKMNEIGQNIRKKRFANGSISFEREKKRFALDEASYPISYKADKRKESNFMVEEYMLLANQKVGKFIVDTCQEIGLLRCHPPPGNVKVNAFEMLLDKLNLKMKFTSSKEIQESSAAIFNDPAVPDTYKAVVRYRMCKVLEAAKYFVVEKIPASEWKHFALSFDIYTHFTSPIRRYPDVLVHRLLEKCLIYKQDVKQYVNKYHMLAIMDKCNECKLNSKRVSDACEKVLTNQVFPKYPSSFSYLCAFT